MRPFKKLHKRFSYLNKRQISKIYQAYLFASSAHAEQKRVSGETYISHPIAVAVILADMHMDPKTIMAALLHDVIEDTDLGKSVIIRKFGKTVAELVDGVTKLSRMNFSSAAEAQAESFRKMILAMAQDIRVIMIKLADRLHNMRTIKSLPAYKRHRIAKETLDIYAPIANRLGMHELYVDLANLAFSTLHPIRYQVISKTIKKARGNRKGVMKTIERDIKKQFAKSKIPSPIILGREKHIYSIYLKMRKRHLSFSEIMDVYAFRIVVNSIDDCYRTLGVMHGLYKPVPGKFKDYIAIPKANGYQSLHTTLFGPHALPLEIQIRSSQMDQVANKGIAAHWLYKSDERIDRAHTRAQQWINDLLEMQQRTGNSLEFIENVKINLFPDEIYVFTPKGGILELPRGSTAVDFAYAVHTDIGNSCVSTRIDHKFAPLSTVLISGQTVAIATAPDARPNPAWLNFVKTAKAKSAIRHFLKKQQQNESVELGKRLLDKALSDLSVSLEKIPKRVIKALLTESGLENLEELYMEIGMGNKVSLLIAHQLIAADKHGDVPKKSVARTDEPLLIRDAEGIAINFAECCHPIPGDPIMGCLIPGKGLVIHIDKCKKIDSIRDQADKCVLVRWADDIKGAFPVFIQMEMLNKPGSFAQVTKAISEIDVSLDDIIINKRTGEVYLITLRVLVTGAKHLKQTIRHLSKLSVVIKVFRM